MRAAAHLLDPLAAVLRPEVRPREAAVSAVQLLGRGRGGRRRHGRRGGHAVTQHPALVLLQHRGLGQVDMDRRASNPHLVDMILGCQHKRTGGLVNIDS